MCDDCGSLRGDLYFLLLARLVRELQGERFGERLTSSILLSTWPLFNDI